MTPIAILGLAALALTAAVTASAYMLPAQAAEGGQSRRESIVEAWVNVAIGWSINFVANLFVMPLVGFHTLTAENNWWMGCVFTGISVCRSYAIRRWFNDRIKRVARAIASAAP